MKKSNWILVVATAFLISGASASADEATTVTPGQEKTASNCVEASNCQGDACHAADTVASGQAPGANVAPAKVVAPPPPAEESTDAPTPPH